MASPQAYTRSSSWSVLSPTSDFYYRPSGEILSGSYRIVSILPGHFDDPIQCRLREVSLKDTTARFLALSYCWNSSKAEETIWCDGRSRKVTVNLFAALRNARAPSSAVDLWIDQICVDQTNIIDRNDQVSKMGAIYRAASGVVVWLGQEGPGTAAAMELPKRVRRFWPSLFENPNELMDHSKTPAECPRWGEGAWPYFVTLLKRPWFRRLWVIQEVVCARDIVVTCGTATAFWEDFVRLVHTVESRTALGPINMLGSKTAGQYLAFMQELRTITQHGTRQAVKDYANEESMAPYVLTMAKDCDATDHRDKLYSFHHLVRLWNRPDYAIDIETLYKVFGVQYLQRIAYAISEFSCDEVILFRRQLEFIYSAGLCNQRLQLPSWCPDWSVPWQARPLWLDSVCYSAGGTEVMEFAPLSSAETPGKDIQFRLPLTVKFFDRVIAAGTQGLKLARGDSDNETTLSETLRAWLFQSMSLLHVNRSRDTPYADHSTAIARTITADQDQGVKLSVDQAIKRYKTLVEALRQSDNEETASTGQDDHQTERFYYSVASLLRGRVLFITEKGYFGLAQEGIAWGDGIAIISGAPVPIAIRPTVSTGPRLQEYQLLCEAFVLDIMDGEVWENKSIPAQQIELA